MVFNAGRFKALCDWFGGSDQLAARVATASGVGHRGRDLVVHCLAGAERGVAVENPRQIPAFRYSKRYGPLPPCFARATVVRNLLPTGPAVLVGGTASICGERSMHQEALAGQIRETLANLGSLVTAAGVSGDPLAAFTHVRLYHPRAQDAAAIESAAAEFTSVDRVQLIQADLCRSELLVEIEGVARLESF
jgi:enamine deaminase RidA (YjgF/YER057c/UK114 family)